MGIFDAFKRDPKTLYFSLSELPQPRHAAVFSIGLGQTVIATSHLTIDATGLDLACRVLTHHRSHVKNCGYKKVVYKNMPDWAQAQLQATLEAL